MQGGVPSGIFVTLFGEIVDKVSGQSQEIAESRCSPLQVRESFKLDGESETCSIRIPPGATPVTTATDSEDGLLNHRRGRARFVELLLQLLLRPAGRQPTVREDLRPKRPRNPGGGGIWRLRERREPSGSRSGRGRSCCRLELGVGVASWRDPGVRRLRLQATPGPANLLCCPTARDLEPLQCVCGFVRRASRRRHRVANFGVEWRSVAVLLT